VRRFLPRMVKSRHPIFPPCASRSAWLRSKMVTTDFADDTAPQSMGVGVWSLEFLWGLQFGAWSLGPPRPPCALKRTVASAELWD